MTLIVGMRFGSRFEIQSDSLITNRDAPKENAIPGRLKSIVLHPLLCVSFAGSADAGIDAIRRLGITPNADFDTERVVDFLLSTHEKTDHAVDFLICSLRGEPQFARVSDGRVAKGGSSYWIGDPDAVNEFSKRFHAAGEIPPDHAEFADLIRSLTAFESLLRERPIDTVGGFRFRAVSLSDSFRYMEEAGAFFPPQRIPSGMPTTLKFGGPEHGGFAYSVLVPTQPGLPLVGVHLFQGRVGYLYVPLQHDEAVLYQDVSHEDFRAEVLADHGIDINGLAAG